jgi:hypothetical protein
MAHAAFNARQESAQANFKDSREAHFRRDTRGWVRRSNLSRTEKEILLAFLNHWFVHRHDGPVHPGRKRLGGKAKASRRMVNYALAMFREFGVIDAVAHETGNSAEGMGLATEYTVDTTKLIDLCQMPKAALREWRKNAKIGEPRINGVQNCTGSGGAKSAPRNNQCNVIAFPSQRRG